MHRIISYEKIIKTIRLAAPFFNDILLRPNPFSNDKIELEWYEIGSDIPFKVLHGTQIAIDIGYDSMMKQCKHFCQWIHRLESLNQSSNYKKG